MSNKHTEGLRLSDFLEFIFGLWEAAVSARIIISIAVGCLVGFVANRLGYTSLAPHLGAGTSIALCVFVLLRMFRSDRFKKKNSEGHPACQPRLLGIALIVLGALPQLLLILGWFIWASHMRNVFISLEVERGLAVLVFPGIVCAATGLYLINSKV
jgi:hypothetical protein